nr:hypothetical protein [uncultured Holophaga sp.]
MRYTALHSPCVAAAALLASLIACVPNSPQSRPGAVSRPPAPDPASLRGTLDADTIHRIEAYRCPMDESQTSLTDSIRLYLSSRDEEPYTTLQSRFGGITVLTLRARGMTRQRAEDLASSVPPSKVLAHGWDRVLLANETEGWIFDMSPARP